MQDPHKCIKPHHFLFYSIGTIDYISLTLLMQHYHVFFPSTGPCKFAVSPLGAMTDWNFIALIRLCPLNVF